MLEGLEQQDVVLLQNKIASLVNDWAINAAEKKGQDADYEYGIVRGLVEAAELISAAQRGEL